MNTKPIYQYIIIEDHPFMREGIKGFLAGNKQYNLVGEYAEVRAAMNSHSHLAPDFVLLDMNMPGIKGDMGCGMLKKAFAGCKVIAVTNYSYTTEELTRLQFDGYINKKEPYPLLEAIETVLNNQTYFHGAIGGNDTEDEIFKKMDAYLLARNVSSREMQVMQLLIRGMTNAQVGKTLYISEETVKKHRQNFSAKTGEKGIAKIIKFLKEHGFE
jgi:DNA-binding NarL/FixJ family response regulator